LERPKARLLGCSVATAQASIALAIRELLELHAEEFLDSFKADCLIDHFRKHNRELVEKVTTHLEPVVIRKVLRGLVREHISIRDLEGIFDILGELACQSLPAEVMTEHIRQSMKDDICRRYSPGGTRILAITIDQTLEEIMKKFLRETRNHTYLSLPPRMVEQFMFAAAWGLRMAARFNTRPVFVCNDPIRPALSSLLRWKLGPGAVLSRGEIADGFSIKSI
jgi:flagellar biosynthesis component FlhA